MYDVAKSSREAMKAKARRLASADSGKVDSSTFTPAEPLRADKKTGLRPVSKQHEFKAGGAASKPRADRPGRKHGGSVKREEGGAVTNPSEVANSMERLRETKTAKDASHVLPPPSEAMKRSGKAPQDVRGRKAGGRAARKSGGRAPNVTVVINDKGSKEQLPQSVKAPPMQGQMPMVQPPVQNMPMPVQRPEQMPSPAARNAPLALKTGGRVSKVAKSYKDMSAGAGSGEGRLQKTDIAKRK